MNKIPFNAVTQTVEAMMRTNAKRATKFIDARTIVRVTRRHKSSKAEFVLKIGSPNYAEREFIKSCRKAGEPIPVKKVQLQFYPKKKIAPKKRK